MMGRLSGWCIVASGYTWKHADRFIDRFVKELGEAKTLLCWVFAAHYLALCWWCVIKNPSSMGTVITTTGTMVGAILSSYIFGSSYEQATRIRTGGQPPPARDPGKSENEHGASD